MSSNNVSVIIVTYNSEKQVKNCLESIFSSKTKKRKVEIIIIDNNSKDKTLKIVKTYFDKKVNIVHNKTNLGFAKAVNQGIKKSKYKQILLLNPDTRLYEKSIEILIEQKKQFKADICGGKMVKTDRTVHGSFVREPNLLTALFDFTNLRKIFPKNKWHKEFYHLDLKEIVKPLEVGGVSGGYMLMDKRINEKNKGFDENFFLYLEDLDYCLRAKKRGFKIFYFPESIIWHKGGGSSKNKDRINYQAWLKSRKYFWRKHSNFTENIIIEIAFLIDQCATYIIKSLKNIK